MTAVQELARFVCDARWEHVSEPSREALKKRVLDAFGCAYGALDTAPVRAIREHTADFGGNPLATLIGGGKTSPDRAAFFNGAAVRYLDFNDCFLGRGEACHPSDNLAPVLAAALLDGQLPPAQYADGRVRRDDVQSLLQRVDVREDAALTAAFPEHQGVRIEIQLEGGESRCLERLDYSGPSTWQALESKFTGLCGPARLIEIVKRLDEFPVSVLAEQL